ncbi:MAG: hypothetical protein P0Y53_21345 [Candidatus Pseudobacter hemicellulosilyticus]|uniref:Uncharacterized protein n=1 Tax=Candidatus Pseudobacter hemicellulosilyticus TaxID=3121375 RepID=A0AAJ5WSU3_9BACT|nr:MAG: hypothetical protein P0Y53_21345 [Pseudobacter sp.]
MKQIKQFLASCCLLLALGWLPASAQTITFYYVAPTASITAAFGSADGSGQMPAGYSFKIITAANAATFLSVAPNRVKYVYNQLQPGTALRTQVDRVFNNSGRLVDVQYYLANDITGVAPGETDMFSKKIRDGRTYVWPAANGTVSDTPGRYTGWVMLGEFFLEEGVRKRDGGILSINEVILHETSHTQWVGHWTKWGAIDGHAITYGADGSHSAVELLGDQEAAINEGLGNFYGFTLNSVAIDSMYHEFTDAGHRYFVEGRSVLAGDALLNAVPSRREARLVDDSGRVVRYPDGRELVVFVFPWRDIPGTRLLFAESSSTAFYTMYWQHAYANRDTAFSFIGHSAHSMFNGRMKRFLTYSCNRLALKIEAYNATAAGQADASKTSSMFPFALLDLVTHFGMTDAEYKADYDRHYPDANPRAYNEYFTNHRAAVRALVAGDIGASPVRFTDALNRIKTYMQQPITIF